MKKGVLYALCVRTTGPAFDIPGGLIVGEQKGPILDRVRDANKLWRLSHPGVKGSSSELFTLSGSQDHKCAG